MRIWYRKQHHSVPKGLISSSVSLAPNSCILCILLPSPRFMVLGRLVHYAADAVLVSTVLAGIKRSSGFA